MSAEPPPAADPEPDPADTTRAALQHGAVRGAYWTIINTFVSVPIAFGVNLLVARVLGVEEYGRLAFLTTLFEIAAAVLALGVGPGIIQFGAKAHSANRRDEVKGLLASGQGFRLMVEVPILTLVLIIVLQVSPALLVAVLVLGILLPAVLNGGPQALGIENKTAQVAQVVLISGLVTQAAVVIAALQVGTPDAIWVTRLAGNGVIVGLALVFVARDYRRALFRPRIPPRFPPGFWPYALPTGLAGLLAILVGSRTEVFALTAWSTPEAVGAYALAFGLAAHLFSPAQALVGPLVPAISGLREIDEQAVLPALLRTVRASATIAGLLLAVALPALALLIPVLYGTSFTAAAPLLLITGVVGGVVVAGNPLQAFVQARLAGRTVLWSNVAGLAVNVVAIVALIPVIGVWGAAIANGAGVLTRLMIIVRSEARALGLATSHVLGRGLPVLIGAFSGILAWVVAGAVDVPTVLRAILAVAVGAPVYVLLIVVARSGLTSADGRAIMGALPGPVARVGGPVLRLLARAHE